MDGYGVVGAASDAVNYNYEMMSIIKKVSQCVSYHDVNRERFLCHVYDKIGT